ncbi:MAG: LTA synthase family protein [Oscillibacter sp.]|nr:LTA synthase family protein [Oscillibacter sp.]
MKRRGHRNQRGPVGPAAVRFFLSWGGAACVGAAAAVLSEWVVRGSRAELWAWFTKWPTYLLLTAALYGAAAVLLTALTGRLYLAAAAVGVTGAGLALVDHFKTAINGTPLVFADFGLATQALHVAGVAGTLRPPLRFWYALAALAAGVLALFFLRHLTALRGRARFLQLGLAAVVCAVLFTPAFSPRVGEVFRVDVYTRMAAANAHDTYGLAVSLWRDGCRTKKAGPEGYGPAYMEGVLSRVDELTAPALPAEDAAAPNVLFILSESFYDLSDLPGVTYEEDPLQSFHALQKEGLSGRFYSHYLGYGTGYIEMSMHTGFQSGDLGAGTNICFMADDVYTRLPSLTGEFTTRGYEARMLHGYDDSLYNRTVTYPLLGYSRLLFSRDIQTLGLDSAGGVYGGYYMRDAYFFRGMLEQLSEINGAGRPAFLYGITMENHQPFKPEKFGGACQIGVESDTLSEEDMGYLRVMLEGITRADRALGELTEALRQLDRPTVVVFYGDHRPNVTVEDGTSIYQKLGLCPSANTAEWSTEEIGELYATDYLIWANDPALLKGLAGEERPSSVTGLGTLLLEVTGAPVSRYWALLERCAGACLADTELYFADGEGRVFRSRAEAELTPEQEELLALREAVVYDALYGGQYVTAAMNDPPGT